MLIRVVPRSNSFVPYWDVGFFLYKNIFNIKRGLKIMEEILEILEKNSRYSDEQIAIMAGKTVQEVRDQLEIMKKKI